MQSGYYHLSLACDGKPYEEHGGFMQPGDRLGGDGSNAVLVQTFDAPTRMQAKRDAMEAGWLLCPPRDGRCYCPECREANTHPRDRRARPKARA